MRRLRQLAPTSDHDSEALRLAPTPPYRLHILETGAPAGERAATLGELIAWCVAKGHDPAPATGFAIHHATRLWLKRQKLETPGVTEAVCMMVGACGARLRGETGRANDAVAFRRAGQTTNLWLQNDKPFEGEGCAEAQRQILMAAARKAR